MSDFSSVISESALTGDEQRNEIKKVIVEHFLRQGMLDIADTLVQVCTSLSALLVFKALYKWHDKPFVQTCNTKTAEVTCIISGVLYGCG